MKSYFSVFVVVQYVFYYYYYFNFKKFNNYINLILTIFHVAFPLKSQLRRRAIFDDVLNMYARISTLKVFYLLSTQHDYYTGYKVGYFYMM